MGGRRHGLRCVTAPALDFGILTETKDSETATVESSFTVTSAYTAEDFVSDTRSAFLACVTEDFGEQVASEAASLVDGQIASMSWYRRFEIWNDLASYDICGVANADHLIDGLEELSVALADGRAFDANGGNPVSMLSPGRAAKWRQRVACACQTYSSTSLRQGLRATGALF